MSTIIHIYIYMFFLILCSYFTIFTMVRFDIDCT